MSRYFSYAWIFIAITALAIGIIEFWTGNFPKGLLPVDNSLPGRDIWVYLTATVFVLSGLMLFSRKEHNRGAFTLGILFGVLFIYPHLVKLLSNIYDAGEWTATVEVMALCSAAFFIPSSPQTHKISRYTFAFTLIVFCILHFMYADYIATLIPSWIPARLFWAYFVGVAFGGVAVSIIINVLMKLATTLLGYMFLFWVLVLHLPRVIAHTKEPEWTSLFVALAMSGACFMLSNLSYKKSFIYETN